KEQIAGHAPAERVGDALADELEEHQRIPHGLSRSSEQNLHGACPLYREEARRLQVGSRSLRRRSIDALVGPGGWVNVKLLRATTAVIVSRWWTHTTDGKPSSRQQLNCRSRWRSKNATDALPWRKSTGFLASHRRISSSKRSK